MSWKNKQISPPGCCMRHCAMFCFGIKQTPQYNSLGLSIGVWIGLATSSMEARLRGPHPSQWIGEGGICMIEIRWDLFCGRKKINKLIWAKWSTLKMGKCYRWIFPLISMWHRHDEQKNMCMCFADSQPLHPNNLRNFTMDPWFWVVVVYAGENPNDFLFVLIWMTKHLGPKHYTPIFGHGKSDFLPL